MTTGDKLSRLRKENNYTQEQLADILGVSRQAISKWESDVAYPETDKLIRLSTLYHCSLDYLVKEDVDEPQFTMPQQRESSNRSVKADRLFAGTLRFAPVILYSLWALLLWALYATKLVPDRSLYEWFGRSAIKTLQPSINALISLGVISCAYIAVLGVLQRFGSKKANLIANVGSFVFQAGIFVCVMCLIGVCKSMGIVHGKVVVVVASVTGSFALLQAVFIALDCYFNHDEKADSKPTRTSKARRCWKFISAHRVMAIIVAFVLLAGIALSIVLPLTVGNIFNTKKVSRIQIGDSRTEVEHILGKPIDIDLEKLVDIVAFADIMELIDIADSNDLKQLTNNIYFYCSPKAEKLIKNILDRFFSSYSPEDMYVAGNELYKMMQELAELEFEYIEVYFEDDSVVEVEYNAKYSMTRENEVKWNVSGKKKQQLKILPSEIPYGEIPYSTELYAQVFYTDGSYRLSRIENVSAVGNATEGWTVTWSDDWGYYTHTIKEGSPKDGDVISRDEVDDNVYFTLYSTDENGNDGYVLKIFGQGALSNRLEYGWEEYADRVVEVVVSDGITNVPNYAFMNFSNLMTLTLPDSISKIGQYAFCNCVNIAELNFSENLTMIGAHAFEGCTGITELTVPANVSIVSSEAFAGCTALQRVDWNAERLRLIGNNVFNNTPNLAVVNFNDVVDIPNGILSGSGVITVNIDSSVESIGARAFQNCTNLNKVNFESEGYRLESIGEYAFSGCTSLQIIEIPKNVRVFSRGVFENCTKLREVFDMWPDIDSGWITEIQDDAFYNCVSFVAPNFRVDYLKRIGSRAFYNCSSLQGFSLKSSYLESIAPYAFLGCTNLTYVDIYIHNWTFTASNGDIVSEYLYGAEVAEYLTKTYCAYTWNALDW